MSEKHLTVLLNRLAPHTHTQRNGGRGHYLALQLGREMRAEGRGLFLHLSASCGLVELGQWRDSNPPPQHNTTHQGPGTTQRTPASVGTDQTRRATAGRRERQQARRGFFSFFLLSQWLPPTLLLSLPRRSRVPLWGTRLRIGRGANIPSGWKLYNVDQINK